MRSGGQAPTFEPSAGAVPNEDDERYRWCPWCKADCRPAPEDQTHQPDCPRVTGCYPVRSPMACWKCGVEMVGHYRVVEKQPHVCASVCDDCAIAAWLGAE